jgi:glutaminyl-peptide cyclotransferase
MMKILLIAMLLAFAFAYAKFPVVMPYVKADSTCFTQGLEIRGEYLYQSCGLYGHSRVLKYRYPEMELLSVLQLGHDRFAEGLTWHQGLVFVLTWRESVVYLLDPQSWSLVDSLYIPTEGWGIASVGEALLVSDGSDRIYRWEPQGKQWSVLTQVRYRGGSLKGINELEWTPAGLFANVFGSDDVFLIDIQTGLAQRVYSLQKQAKYQKTDPNKVVNGIAWDHQNSLLLFTGKKWSKFYQVPHRMK